MVGLNPKALPHTVCFHCFHTLWITKLILLWRLTPPESRKKSSIGILPSIHLDHSDSLDHLLDYLHTFVRHHCSLQTVVGEVTHSKA